MRDKLGWATNHPGLVTAQAKVSGDTGLQDIMDLLARANVLEKDRDNAQLSQFTHGSLTGPADFEGGNVFEKAFKPQSGSSGQLGGPSEDKHTPLAGHDNIIQNGAGKVPPMEATPPETSNPPSPGRGSSLSQGSKTPDGRSGLKRTRTDLSLLNLQTKLSEAMARPYIARDEHNDEALLSPTPMSAIGGSFNANVNIPSIMNGHPKRWVPLSQAVFTTEISAPWTILAANDLACLVFGVTKAEVRKLGILEVVREDERGWLEEKLRKPGYASATPSKPLPEAQKIGDTASSALTMGGGVTAKLLSKPSSRQLASQKASKKSANDANRKTNGMAKNTTSKSKGVLLCGDVVPIQKRNGATGSASLWVKEKQGGLIWVMEEIHEDTAFITLDSHAKVTSVKGSSVIIWGDLVSPHSMGVGELLPHLPLSSTGSVDFSQVKNTRYYAARNMSGVHIPTSITLTAEPQTLRVSSFPHIAGIIVLSASTLEVKSSNSVFSAALFGQTSPDGLSVNDLIPGFDRILDVLAEDDKVTLQHGIVVPEHSFRRARAVLALRDGNADAAAISLHPPALIAKHRDGSEINIDVQMRVVESERAGTGESTKSDEKAGTSSESASESSHTEASSEVVYALWITYSRQLHSRSGPGDSNTTEASKPSTPRQPSPGQNSNAISPQQMDSDDNKPSGSSLSNIKQQIEEAASQPISSSSAKLSPMVAPIVAPATPKERAKKKKINDFTILEDLGQGAYGSVKLARYAKGNGGKVVLKYVTKKRILVDTWTRDRRLGTVPLEIHVLDYLRRDNFRHPNIVEMTDFFEDDINYYIEMVPHGLPGMDLFDYIEMRSNMEEAECRNIFLQVVAALHHLHTKALVVHRDIKDENIILDGENNVKLIDFGSAAYIKSGPFDVFVGTIGKQAPTTRSTLPQIQSNPFQLMEMTYQTNHKIIMPDYAAPEVLGGIPYRGKEQDVWALGILLYTLVYKENPFYSIDEIIDHELRIPWVMSEGSIDLIKAMLNREVDQRYTITQVMEHDWCMAGAEA